MHNSLHNVSMAFEFFQWTFGVLIGSVGDVDAAKPHPPGHGEDEVQRSDLVNETLQDGAHAGSNDCTWR